MVLLVIFQDFLDGVFRGHCLLVSFLGHFIARVSILVTDWSFYQLIPHLIGMRNNIGSHSTPLGLNFRFDFSGLSGLPGLEPPKRCCDLVLTLDYGRLPGGAHALGPSELLDDTTIWDPLSAVKSKSSQILKTRKK